MSIYHKHHIIPKHMGGSDDPSNLIQLTIEEHAEAHRRLFEQHGHWQDEIAWKGLAKMIDRAELIRTAQVKAQKNKKTHKHNEETKEKIRIAALNRSNKRTKGTKIGCCALPKNGAQNPMFGRKHSPETILKMRESQKNRSKNR